LDDGWHELLQMWENRQQLLSQSLSQQVRINIELTNIRRKLSLIYCLVPVA
jgi:hypothetical protein